MIKKKYIKKTKKKKTVVAGIDIAWAAPLRFAIIHPHLQSSQAQQVGFSFVHKSGNLGLPVEDGREHRKNWVFSK